MGNLPDLVQQSSSPSATPTATALQELGDIAEVGNVSFYYYLSVNLKLRFFY